MIQAKNSQTRETLFLQLPILTITWPDGTQQQHRMIETVLKIGRGEEHNHIAAPDEYKSISRKHLEIRRQGVVYQAADLGSTNGVLVNNQLIETSTVLKENDQIRIGSEIMAQQTLIDFQIEAAASVSELAPSLGTDTILDNKKIVSQIPADSPYLEIYCPEGEIKYFVIERDVTLVGCDDIADLQFPQSLKYISNRHLEIWKTDDDFSIIDLQSTNGTWVNNQLLEPGIPTPLRDKSIIRIGEERFGISIGMTFHHLTETQIDVTGFSPSVEGPTVISEMQSVLIGREDSCNIVLSSPDVSRIHARMLQAENVFWIEDLGSSNGTFVNQQPITRTQVHEGDTIQIGKHILLFKDGQLARFQSHGMRLDVTNLSKDVKTKSGPLRILHHINMTILPREFIAVVGGSGAGKSTFMNALIGFRPGEGEVALNGHNFYRELAHFRSQLGYVPQSDILHTSLSVEKALNYAAQLRLPADISAKERDKQIAEVLETVSMNTDTIRKTRISNLSGGQRKKVSIAAELLADPKLIYLDEATSGLDPGLEKKMMYTLRRMADEGRTVILITHATDNIRQTDHVAFLAQGRLVYFGPSQEALDFFDVDDFADIYEQIERHGEKWENIFQEKKPEHQQKYVLNRKKNRPDALKRDLPKIRFGLRDFIRQFIVLTQRAFSVLMSDQLTLVLMLLLFPLTATLQLMIASSDILIGDLSILADPIAAAQRMSKSYLPFADLNTFLFVMGLEAVLVGMYVPSNELIKERTIYLRERMVTLKMLPYLLSKVAVFTIFAAIQTFLYLIVLSIGVDFPDEGYMFSAPVELYITLFLTMLAGMGIGFIVSAVSRSSDMAIYVLVILLFFQFFFAGTVFDLRDNPAEFLSYFTTTRWSLTALGVTIDMEEQVEATIICNNLPDNPMTPEDESNKMACANYPDATDDLMLPYDGDKLVEAWDILALMAVVSLVITGILIKRLDKI